MKAFLLNLFTTGVKFVTSNFVRIAKKAAGFVKECWFKIVGFAREHKFRLNVHRDSDDILDFQFSSDMGNVNYTIGRKSNGSVNGNEVGIKVALSVNEIARTLDKKGLGEFINNLSTFISPNEERNEVTFMGDSGKKQITFFKTMRGITLASLQVQTNGELIANLSF